MVVSACDSERERLRDLIEGYRGCQVVGLPVDANSILTVVAETKPDVTILDCAECDTIALGVCRLLMRFQPKMQLLLHTDRTSRYSTTDAVREGVRAIVLRSGSDEHLLPALEALADRRPYWEEAVDDEILDELLEQGPRPPRQASRPLNEWFAAHRRRLPSEGGRHCVGSIEGDHRRHSNKAAPQAGRSVRI
jgi:DNA-binding NarL/FixJ family response regulator